jgi:non-canonical (house-cleaning) NTP pyrophosphatase
MSTHASSAKRAPRQQIERIALGSDRAAKIMAVRACIARIGAIDSGWREANVVARAVKTNAPAMPLTDWELMKGARDRAHTVYQLLREQNLAADLYVGLEGGFHSISIDGEWHTFLRGWAYATDGDRSSFGMSPSIEVPEQIVKTMIEGRKGLGTTGRTPGPTSLSGNLEKLWGAISKDLTTAAPCYESALIAAFARFYNADFIEQLLSHGGRLA